MTNFLPLKIHYCWFGKNELPESAKKCIESWKKFFPHYQIIEWNEDNYPISEKPLYLQQAYQAKKWAFVSDYARFDILNQEGGIYFDTDVEVIKEFGKILETNFMGLENAGLPAAGLGMGFQQDNLFLTEILKLYQNDSFVKADGSYNLETVVRKTVKILSKYNLGSDDVQQFLAELNLTIYPSDFMAPKKWDTREINITNNTVSIHHCDATWWTPEQRAKMLKKEKMVKDGVDTKSLS